MPPAHAFLPAIETESEILWLLEEKDEIAEAATFVSGNSGKPGPAPSPDLLKIARLRSSGSYYRWEAPRQPGQYGKRVSKYVAQRRAECAEIEKVSLLPSPREEGRN